MKDKRNETHGLVSWKSPLSGFCHKREDHPKVDLKEREWIHLYRNRDCWRGLVNADNKPPGFINVATA
jgi:hypothetical protein